MKGGGDPHLSKVYAAKSLEEQRANFDDWAAGYEDDVARFGFRIPAVAAALFARHAAGEGPVLDAGCGTGLMGEPLAMAGYGPLTGLDLSPGMLEVARSKGIYAELIEGALGGRLPFDYGAFAAVICVGVLSPGHAPASSFEDMARVTRPGGRMVFSLRADAGGEYVEALDGLVAEGRLKRIAETPAFAGMPLVDPTITHRVHVVEAL